MTPGVYYQVNGSSEWVNKLDPNTPITSLKVETRGGALLTEEIVQQFADLSLTQLDMSNAIYESHTFPRPHRTTRSKPSLSGRSRQSLCRSTSQPSGAGPSPTRR